MTGWRIGQVALGGPSVGTYFLFSAIARMFTLLKDIREFGIAFTAWLDIGFIAIGWRHCPASGAGSRIRLLSSSSAMCRISREPPLLDSAPRSCKMQPGQSVTRIRAPARST